MNHKKDCLWWDDEKQQLAGQLHRVPIDCVTEQDLWDSIGKLRKDKEGLLAQLTRLKALLYDAAQGEEEV